MISRIFCLILHLGIECLGWIGGSGQEIHIILYINLGNKKFNNKNEEENSVQSRLPRHVAEFW